MEMSDVVAAQVEQLYAAYGTDSGCLFGLTPEQRPAVEAIVTAVHEWVKEEIDRLRAENERLKATLPIESGQTTYPAGGLVSRQSMLTLLRENERLTQELNDIKEHRISLNHSPPMESCVWQRTRKRYR